MSPLGQDVHFHPYPLCERLRLVLTRLFSAMEGKNDAVSDRGSETVSIHSKNGNS
jgi:hypothetical protein